jgi:S4 domain protein YaaA
MEKVTINSEYITLGQFLKYVGIIDCGSYAKQFLLEEKVLINNEQDQRRGRKIYPGDIVEVNKKRYEVDKIVSE